MVIPVHKVPFPSKPEKHVQLYDPILLVHAASALQLFMNPSEHSSTSIKKYEHGPTGRTMLAVPVHTVPLPVNPAKHVQ